jgi:hypothetical protein
MDKVVLIVIGLLAVGYVARMVWKELKGETQCHCSGGCGGSCHSKEDK